MSCYPACPDCKNGCAAAPDIPSMADGIEHGGCRCFPANAECPSSAACLALEPHITLPSGMVRSDDSGKPDYTLIDTRILARLASHLTAQVPVKGRNNWRLASTEDDLQRFLASAWRHFIAWQNNDTDEDHASALIFNLMGAEHVRSQLRSSA